MLTALTDKSTIEEKEFFVKWDRAYHMCMQALKGSVFEHLSSGLQKTEIAKELYKAVGERYQKSSKFKVGNLMSELKSMKYDSVGGVRDFIMKMVHIQTKSASHDITLPNKFIVHHALNSLPIEFTQIKTTYNDVNEVWSVNDLISKCVFEKEKLKKEKSESALLTTNSKPYYQKNFKKPKNAPKQDNKGHGNG
ncbi:PREDICTED: uncharacterized protein LOC108661588 [Theobroma cacao]|uniref:Uncharacterized protein LOC108661588 n=1 Tax=Theobroma cacao TaxID=3641 RepID=A0AB32W645_THECC|nr:PREDICTED: uncharacterized protein LOC108661588 [Theobroma cacao]